MSDTISKNYKLRLLKTLDPAIGHLISEREDALQSIYPIITDFEFTILSGYRDCQTLARTHAWTFTEIQAVTILRARSKIKTAKLKLKLHLDIIEMSDRELDEATQEIP